MCVVDEGTALVHLAAFSAESRARLRESFPRLLEVDGEEAVGALACNAAAFFGTHVVIDRRARKTAERLDALGYEVKTVDTGEFLKSGGSVFCLKQTLL